LGVSGAAELLDGNVALVLDLEQLIEAQVSRGGEIRP
jgi:chemotaxis protein histidine kinase CheA